MNPINVAWLALVALIFLLEGMAVKDQIKGNTISENLWKMRTTTLGRFILWPGLLWLCWHILASGGGFGWPDGVAIGVGVVIAGVLEKAL